MTTPTVVLDDDGRHILWSHECNFPNLDGSTWHADTPLPLDGQRGWRVEKTEPLTISPSILCGSCGIHGFWREGKWVSV